VKCEGNDDVVPDGLHVEGNVISRKMFVGEGLVIAVVSGFVHMRQHCDAVKGRVVNVHGTLVEVGGIEITGAVMVALVRPV